ncbi:sulfate reduction electron transfer complex DsrMKJOP subunit DsrM [Chloroflexota bacterium]
MNALYALFGVVLLILFAFFGVWGMGWHTLFAVIFPYAAVAIFVVGIVYRVVKWARAPVPFHIPTVCGQQKSLPWIKSEKIESPNSTAGVIVRMALEVLLFRSLFRNEKFQLENRQRLIFKGNRLLWLGGLVFHWSLLTILFRHSRLFIQPIPDLIIYVRDIDGIAQGLIPAIYLTDIAILIALTYLFIRRVIYPQIRYISLPSDYFALFLLLGVIILGVLVRWVFKVDIGGVKELAMGALIFKPVIPDGIGLAFYIHIFLVSVLFAYFPFSKMIHAAGIFFSPTRNLKNNSRLKRHVNPWDYPVKVHTYEEWEDEFREKIRGVGLPLEKE